MKKYLKLILITIILFFVLICIFLNNFQLLNVSEVQAVVISDYEINNLEKNKNPLKIDEILINNTQDNIREEMIFEEIALEHTTKYINNDKLPSGTMHVTQVGQDGKQDVITIKKYNNDELESEQIVASNIKKAAINKVIEIGTGRGKNTYKLKENDIVYVTAKSLPVMEDSNSNSTKLVTISQGTKVIAKRILNSGWSYIVSEEANGYVLSEALSNINPNEIENIQVNENEKTKEELLATLNFDMELNKPSGLSLEQFRKILQYNKSDVNDVFTQNSDYFYYAEQEYGINGVFLAAIAIHESGWGTSNISTNKKNLFGYMAYDSSSYSSAKQFSTYSEGIDLLARVLIKYYLNPNGSAIYGGNIAEGKYYNGKTVTAVNKNYASDKNWANAVYGVMKTLYNNL